MTFTYENRPLKWAALLYLHQDDACLIWPFGRDKRGKPYSIWASNKAHLTARFICKMVNGPPPTPNHQAAHSCGRANDGCVNPKHLRWATPTENNRDKELHGTKLYGEKNPKAKLTAEQVLEIRRRAAAKEQTEDEMAAEFGVSHQLIYFIKTRRVWKHI